MDNFDEPFTLYVRVKKPFIGAKIVISSHGHIIYKRTYPALRPAEMIEIELELSMFRGDERELTIEVKQNV